MKKLFLAAIVAVFALASCDPKEPVGGKLTPEENKKKMEEISVNLAKQINPADFTDFTETMQYLLDEVGLPFGNAEPDPVVPLGEASAPLFIGKLGVIGNVNTVATRAAVTVSEFYGVWTYTDGKWVETASETEAKIVFTHKGETVTIAASASGKETEVTVEGETVSVPAKVVAKITKGSKTLADITVDVVSIAADATTGEVNTLVNLCGYSVDTKTKVTSSDVSVNAGVSKGTTKLISVASSAAGSNLVPTGDANNAKIGKVNATIGLMDAAWLKGSSNDFQKVIDGHEDLDKEYYDKPYDQAYAQKYSKIFNDNVNVFMNYDNSDSAIAKLEMAPAEDDYDEWSAEPILVFTNDSSKFSLDEFFNEKDFSKLVDVLKDLGEKFDELLGYDEQQPDNGGN